MKLAITGQEFLFELDISSKTAKQLVAQVLSIQPEAYQSSTITQHTTSSIDLSGARRAPEKIVAIGVYLKQRLKHEYFDKSLLIKGFEDLAQKVPKNLSRDIAWAVQIGWLAPKTTIKGCYYVTTQGEQAVTDKFALPLVAKTTIRALK